MMQISRSVYLLIRHDFVTGSLDDLNFSIYADRDRLD